MLICFDYDGVIVDSINRLLRINHEAQQWLGCGRPPQKTDFETIENLTFPVLAETLGIPQSRVSNFADKVFELLEQDAEEISLFSGIPQILAELVVNHCLCIITANSQPVVADTLQNSGILPLISYIFDGRDQRSKAEKIQAAILRFGFDPTQTVMVGDSRGDIREGHHAGVQTIAVTWGFQSREVLQLETPHYFADSPQKLLEIVERL
ncbi:MAG: HAD family hydrolase [SAR324 cluster bacterium]|nr:HAD family hydrolase [SAR324 cluster bacterium]